MKNNLHKQKNLIAPCGMNCGICVAYQRKRKPCGGCRNSDLHKPRHCAICVIKNCSLLAATSSGFCYECEKYPCTRLKQLDKRYRTRYNMSMLENLENIRAKGMDTFIQTEDTRWKCRQCGRSLCAHRDFCLYCNADG